MSASEERARKQDEIEKGVKREIEKTRINRLAEEVVNKAAKFDGQSSSSSEEDLPTKSIDERKFMREMDRQDKEEFETFKTE